MRDKKIYIPSWVWNICLGFSIWRVGLFLLSLLAPYLLLFKPSFPYADVIFTPYHLPTWLYSWANFDGVHYLTIIEKGYREVNFIQAFFPVFPILVSSTTILFANVLLSGLVVSNIFTLLAAILWYVLLKHNQIHPTVGLLVLGLFPTAFFFGAFYTESLFLCLVLGSFLAAQHKQWLLAGILAGVASGTRIVGVFLVPALLVEWLLQYRESGRSWPTISLAFVKQNWQVITGIGLGMSGLLAYMWYLHQTFGDALHFFHVQSEFGSGRQESLILYPQVVWRYVKILLTARPIDWHYFAYIQEFAAGTLGLVGLLLAWYKRIRFSYILFALAAFILPTLTGTFSSLSRYMLVCFPIFMVITQSLHNRPRLMIGYLLLSGLLLAMNVVLFIQGYWVA